MSCGTVDHNVIQYTVTVCCGSDSSVAPGHQCTTGGKFSDPETHPVPPSPRSDEITAAEAGPSPGDSYGWSFWVLKDNYLHAHKNF